MERKHAGGDLCKQYPTHCVRTRIRFSSKRNRSNRGVESSAPGGGTSSTQGFSIIAAIPQFASSASSVSFGNIAQGASSSAQAITLTNTGTAVLSISAIGASGDFSQTNSCGGTLAVNATCQVSIVFTPTAIGQRTVLS
jgi:hypothetical protein